MNDLTRYALAAAARGWHVFPLTPGGKIPLKGWAWTEHHTTDPATISRFWSGAPYNIGIATGPSRLVVVDLDTPKKEGLRPPPPWDLPGVNDGADVLAVLCERAGQPLPFDTFIVTTRRGGLHLYFTPPDGPPLGNTSGDKGNGLGWLIDTRAHGGYVVGPGSVVDLDDGAGTYEVLDNTTPAPLPPWLFQRLLPPPQPPQRPVTVTLPDGRKGAYLRAALDSELERVATAPRGQRNHTLYLAAVALGQLAAGDAIPDHEVTALLKQAGMAAGLAESETALTVASGLRAGAKRPRSVAA
ncbi:bifunctional DNA primase/polymerase [Planotetraspora phitsanulokensis]|uniref:DNA primase n=1 Tax=Planotetraspora phitsanulokensis TaxID=575192 RepID=A0A8J3XGN9_9ACTN|nr:bifunctional DNA primase/polymerase [Planotetraspora phitsanulokensis]GII40340.1 DNA primase [Planotetraspora phitsanulokensis]